MNRLILLLGITVIFAACDDKNKDNGNGQLDPNAMISLRAAPSGRASASVGHLTALEIVEQTSEIVLINKDRYPDSDRIARGFADAQKDLINERLLMWGTDIISQDGRWEDGFIGGSDIVLERPAPANEEYPYPHTDTIAYIKNATIHAAKVLVKEAYDRGDYKTVYKLFDEAFVFEPITGPEWRALKEQGLN